MERNGMELSWEKPLGSVNSSVHQMTILTSHLISEEAYTDCSPAQFEESFNVAILITVFSIFKPI